MSAWLFCEGKRRIYQDKRFQDSGHFPNFSYIFTLVEKLVIHLSGFIRNSRSPKSTSFPVTAEVSRMCTFIKNILETLMFMSKKHDSQTP